MARAGVRKASPARALPSLAKTQPLPNRLTERPMFTKRLLAAAFAAVMCVPAYADDALTPPAEQSVLPRYNQLPQNYEEFAAMYNKVLAVLRDAGVQSIHECFPLGSDPNWSHGWCQDKMKLPNRKGGYLSSIETQVDDRTVINKICLSDDPAEQRCFFSTGKVVDQALNQKTHIYLTYREVAGSWNERGKPLSDLKPDAPPVATPTPPAAAPTPPAEQSPPAAASVLPPKYNQIPQDYEEFAAVHNKALAFLRTTGAQSIHKCFPAGSNPNDRRGWCQDYMMWSDPKGQHIMVSDDALDDGKHIVVVCLGDDMNARRCYHDDGGVFDQTHDRKINLWVNFRQVAGAWNERGKPLSDLTPRGPSPPTAAALSPPAATPSPSAEQNPPAATSALPPKFDQIPNSYDEFAPIYNKALAFLRNAGIGSIHKCFPAGSDPNDHRGWCEDSMWWVNDTGQHLAAVDTQRDDGTKVISLCFGDPNTQRCYEDNGKVFDQSLNRKINIWVTLRQAAGAWNERGKPLSDLKPRATRGIKR
jgi:hypothetical protein